jgi:hypothetical protein
MGLSQANAELKGALSLETGMYAALLCEVLCCQGKRGVGF